MQPLESAETVELARKLVGIESVNPSLDPSGSGEGDIAGFVADWLSREGLSVEVREPETGRASVLGRLSGTGDGPSLMLNAHLDTVGAEGVEDPFSGRLAEGRIHGRGAYDMKGALAACMAAAAAIGRSDAPLRGDLVIAAVADEEHASLGTRDLLADHRTDGAVVAEPTGLELCVAHKGFMWLEAWTEGRAAHGSRRDEGVDANRRMGRLLVELDELDRELQARPAHPLLGTGSLHVGVLEGGTGVSTYAARCRARIERRTVPGEDAAEAEDEIRALLDRVARDGTGCGAGLERALTRSPFEADPEGDLAAAVRGSASRHLGREPAVVGEGPWTDAALLQEAGVETVVFGPEGSGAHADEEWVEADSVVALARVLEATAREFCGTA